VPITPPPTYVDPPSIKLLLNEALPTTNDVELDRKLIEKRQGKSKAGKMEVFITTHANDTFLYPIDPSLPEAVQEQLRSDRQGPALYLASVHLKVPHDVRPKELKGGIQKVEVTLSGRESLSVSFAASLLRFVAQCLKLSSLKSSFTVLGWSCA
jgi:hypothetical protein